MASRRAKLRGMGAAHPRPDLLNLAERMEQLDAGPRGHGAGEVLLPTRTGLEQPLLEFP
ncbi:hypothetical protein [Hyalangium gracile]|uniref:hypothetical protein n=1 Tax=Hyalangium gracile TaxID=394092 RepID=UPI001CD02909|nr:hypothetical protein [Hyalangium gracile]